MFFRAILRGQRSCYRQRREKSQSDDAHPCFRIHVLPLVVFRSTAQQPTGWAIARRAWDTDYPLANAAGVMLHVNTRRSYWTVKFAVVEAEYPVESVPVTVTVYGPAGVPGLVLAPQASWNISPANNIQVSAADVTFAFVRLSFEPRPDPAITNPNSGSQNA